MEILTNDGKPQEKRQTGEPTGFVDNLNVPIKVGDRMDVPHFCNCEYCDRREIVTILWNDDIRWKAYGMKTDDGRWISGMGMAGSFSRIS